MSIFSRTRGSKVRLIAAVILTVLAGVSAYYYLMSVRQTVSVVVAAQDISPNTVITDKNVRVADISANSKHQLAFSDQKQVVGSVTTETVHKDMQLISSQLAGKDGNSLKAGETLLPLSDVIASPDLKAGNNVSIVVTSPEGAFTLGSARIHQIKGEILTKEKGIDIKGKEAVLVIDKSQAESIIGAVANAKSVYLLLAQGG